MADTYSAFCNLLNSWNWRWCKTSSDRPWRRSGKREWNPWAFTGYLSFNLLFCTEFLLFGFVVSNIWECEMPEWQTLMVGTYIQAPPSTSASSSILECYPVDWCLIAISMHRLLHSDNELLGRHNPLVAAVRGLACDLWQLKRAN